MAEDTLAYKELVDAALRGVVAKALEQVAAHGLPGEHHFTLTFRTDMPGVDIPAELRQRFPEEMTIVIQHQFHDLSVGPEGFAVGLSFAGVPRRLSVPFAALTAFADPHAEFALQFAAAKAGEDAATDEATEEAGGGDAKVVTLEAFRKT